MKHISHALLLCLSTLLFALPATANDDVAAIDALYAEWRSAVEDASIDRYVAILHPDVRLLPPGAEPIVSAKAYGEFLVPVFDTATYKIEVGQMPQIDVVGDTAVAEYIYSIELTLKNPDVQVNEPGALTANRTTSRYFDVLRKNDDGQWRVWRHSWQAIADQ